MSDDPFSDMRKKINKQNGNCFIWILKIEICRYKICIDLIFLSFFVSEFDGLFGLGISEDIKRKGLIYDNIPRNSSRKNVFSIYYPKSVDDNGAITFGGYDKK